VHQGGAEGAGAHQGDGPVAVGLQDGAQGVPQADDVVPEALGAELAKVGEILADLGGAGAEPLPEIPGGDHAVPALSHELQGAQVVRQAADNDGGHLPRREAAAGQRGGGVGGVAVRFHGSRTRRARRHEREGAPRRCIAQHPPGTDPGPCGISQRPWN